MNSFIEMKIQIAELTHKGKWEHIHLLCILGVINFPKISKICHIEEPPNAILMMIFVISPALYPNCKRNNLYFYMLVSYCSKSFRRVLTQKKQINVFRNVYKTPLLLYTLSFSHNNVIYILCIAYHSNNKIFDPFIRTRSSSENNNASHHPS